MGQQNLMKALKAGMLYFVLVFGTGFVLGTIRTLWIVPRLGTGMAELLEMPARSPVGSSSSRCELTPAAGLAWIAVAVARELGAQPQEAKALSAFAQRFLVLLSMGSIRAVGDADTSGKRGQ
jgi:hypothetical protein